MGKNTNTPVVTLEIELDKCGLKYGEGACTARVQGTLGYVEKTRWDQGNNSSIGNAYYNAANERLVVNTTDRNGNDPDIFNLGWREIARYDIGTGTATNTATLLNGGGEVEVSNFVAATNPANPAVYSPKLPLEDNSSLWRIRIFGNSVIPNGTSLTGNLDFRVSSNASARYRIGGLTNLSSVFGTNALTIGGGTMVFERFNPSTLTDGEWRIRRIHPTTAEEDVFSVGGMSITGTGTERFIRVGGASHGAIAQTGANIVEIARWNAGLGTVSNQADFEGANSRIRVSRTPLSGVVPVESDGLHFYRLRRINVSGSSVGTLTTEGAFTVFPTLVTAASVSFEIGAAAGMTAGFGTADLNTVDNSQWVLERGDILPAQIAFTSPMREFDTSINSPETGTNPAYMWALSKNEVLPHTGETKCYNTFEECQDIPNYTKVSPGRTFKFCTKGVLIEGFNPTITESGTSHQPPAIKRDFDMWQREVVRVKVEDLPAPDSELDDDYVLERPVAGNKRVVNTPPVITFVEKATYIQGDAEESERAYMTLGGTEGNNAALIVSNTALTGNTPLAGQLAGHWRLTRDLGGLPTAMLDGALTIDATRSTNTHTAFIFSSKEDLAFLFGDGVQIGGVTLSYPSVTASWEQGDGNDSGEAFFQRSGNNAGNLIVNNTPATGTIPTTGRVRVRRTGGTLPTTSPSGAGYFGKWNVGNSEEIHNAEQVTNALSFNRTPTSSGDRIGSDNSIDNDEWFGIGQTATVIYTTTETETEINNIASYNAGSSVTAGNASYSSNGFVSTNPDSALTGSFPTDLTLSYRLRRVDNSAMTPFGTLIIVSTFSNARNIRINDVATMQTAFGNSDISSGSGWVLEQQITTPSGTATEYSGAVKSIAGLGLGNSPAGNNYFGRWKLRTVIGATFATVDVLGHIDFHIQAQVPGPALGSNNTIQAAEWLNVGDTLTLVHTLPNGDRKTYTGLVSSVVDPASGFARVVFANSPTSSINSEGGTLDLWRGNAQYVRQVASPVGRWDISTTNGTGNAVRSSTEIRINDTDADSVDRSAILNEYTAIPVNVIVVVGDGLGHYTGTAIRNTEGTGFQGLIFRGGDFETTGSGIPTTHFDTDTDFRLYNLTDGLELETHVEKVEVEFENAPLPNTYIERARFAVGENTVAGNAEWNDTPLELHRFAEIGSPSQNRIFWDGADTGPQPATTDTFEEVARFNIGPITTPGNAIWNDLGTFSQTNTWLAGVGQPGIADVGTYYAGTAETGGYFRFWNFTNVFGITNNAGDIWKLRQVGGNEIIGQMTVFGGVGGQGQQEEEGASGQVHDGSGTGPQIGADPTNPPGSSNPGGGGGDVPGVSCYRGSIDGPNRAGLPPCPPSAPPPPPPPAPPPPPPVPNAFHFAIGGDGAMRDELGTVDISTGGAWILEKETTPPERAICYNSVHSGVLPRNTNRRHRIRVINNSGPNNNNVVEGIITNPRTSFQSVATWRAVSTAGAPLAGECRVGNGFITITAPASGSIPTNTSGIWKGSLLGLQNFNLQGTLSIVNNQLVLVSADAMIFAFSNGSDGAGNYGFSLERLIEDTTKCFNIGSYATQQARFGERMNLDSGGGQFVIEEQSGFALPARPATTATKSIIYGNGLLDTTRIHKVTLTGSSSPYNNNSITGLPTIIPRYEEQATWDASPHDSNNPAVGNARFVRPSFTIIGHNTPKTGSLPTDTSGIWQLRRADQDFGVSGSLTLTPDFGGTLITIGDDDTRRIVFGVPLVKTGAGWILEKLKPQLYNGVQIGTEAETVAAFGPDDISSGDGNFKIEVLDTITIPGTYTEQARWEVGSQVLGGNDASWEGAKNPSTIATAATVLSGTRPTAAELTAVGSNWRLRLVDNTSSAVPSGSVRELTGPVAVAISNNAHTNFRFTNYTDAEADAIFGNTTWSDGGGEWVLERQDTAGNSGVLTTVAAWVAGSGSADETAIYQSNGLLVVNNIEDFGSIDGNVPSGFQWRIRQGVNRTDFGDLTITSTPNTNFRNIRVGTNADMIEVFGSSQITTGRNWELERLSPEITTTDGEYDTGFSFTSAAVGAYQTNQDGRHYRLRLIGNSNLPTGATGVAEGTLSSSSHAAGLQSFETPDKAAMRTAFGTGNNINSGGGYYLLEERTAINPLTSGTFDLWMGPSLYANTPEPILTFDGDITNTALGTNRRIIRAGTTTEMTEIFGGGATNNSDLPAYTWQIFAGVETNLNPEVINPPNYRWHILRQEQISGGSNLETTVAGSPGIITPESTYMKRWLERNRNYNRRPAKFSVGSVVNGEFVESFVSHLTVDEVDLDKKGETVTLILKDGIKLKATDGAVVPKPSNIQLGNDIDDTIIGSGTTLNLIGNADEIAELVINDRLNIDREVVRIISKSGNSVNVARGDDGSAVSDHDTNTTVQLCYRKSGINAADIYNELLNDYADTRGIHFARDEFDIIKNSYLGAFRLSANITKPVGVDTIIKEIQEATATTMYFDSRRQEFRLKSINGLNTGFNPDSIPITDDMIIQNTGTIADRPRESLTSVLLHIGLRDATDFGKKSKDWKNVLLIVDETQESDNARGERKQKVIYNRWLSSTQATSVANSYLREGRVSTSEFVFDITLNADGTVPFELGELYEYRGRLSANAWGAPELYPFRVLQVSIIDYRTARVLATRSSITPSAVTAFVIGRSRYDSGDVLL